MHSQFVPTLPHNNVDNVVKNTVQAFDGFLTNIGLGEGGKYGEVNLLSHRQMRE